MAGAGMSGIVARVRAGVGLLTLDRPKALNALDLPMIRELTATLLGWREDPAVQAVAIRGQGRDKASAAGSPFGVFCAGGDIRFFHQAALSGDPRLEDFFTEEYLLNYLIHQYPKPYISFLDGVAMGGGLGISGHGRGRDSLRIVTERTRMAMPETNIGLFPDVGGGYFLSRCQGRIGEYLALTGEPIGGADAVDCGLADVLVESTQLEAIWDQLGPRGMPPLEHGRRMEPGKPLGTLMQHRSEIDDVFALPDVRRIIGALESGKSEWAQRTAAALRMRSPLMLHVTLEQVRRGRVLSLADELRMERGMVRHCFHLRPGVASETVEGIRALAVDKDQRPLWNPARIEEVTPEMVEAFFASPWPSHAHPLRHLD
jgi:enoyl-CoA hydratase/carnithine racemase